MAKVGIQIGASTFPRDLPTVARLAEELGYREMWLAEDYFQLGGVASVSTVLAATERIPVGLGVVAAPVRHPGVTAMEFATLGGSFPGRFMGGLGHGAPNWVRQMGITPASPMGLLREAIEAIRQLLDGGTVVADGTYFRLDDVKLDHPPSVPVPLYFGVQGPASLRLSGELADGTLLGWFSSPGSVRWAKDRISEGLGRGERQGSHEVVALCLLSVSEDERDVVDGKMARWAAPMVVARAGSPAIKSSPEGLELAAFVAEVGERSAREGIPIELLRRFMAVGDPDDCAATVQNLLAAGADRVVLVPNPAGVRSTSEMIAQMELASGAF